MDGSKEILDAISALDEKFDRKFDALKTADDHIAEEVQKQGRRIERLEQDVRDHKSESTRAREDDKATAQTTMEAIVKHVDESAAAFREKAADIDALKKETAAQSTELAAQTAILKRLDSIAANPMVRKVAYFVGTAILMWLASKGVK